MQPDRVVFVDGVRTPFGRAGEKGMYWRTRADDMVVSALIGLLERRLDAVVYRMKFVPTVFASRQFVNHGHVTVNGKRVNIASYQVKDGDVVTVRDKSRNMALILEAIESGERDVPDYLDVDHNDMKGSYIRAPKLADVPYPVQMQPSLVIEFYSR